MSWSRAEVLALATKAARGAGAPPAQAAHFGRAAAIHLGQRRDAAALGQALDALPAGAIMRMPLQLQELLLAARSTAQHRLEIPTGGQPSLLRSYLETLPHVSEVVAAQEDSLEVTVDTTTLAPSLRLGRVEGCAALLAQMTALAARTFVPDSETSRRAGAGAGTSDND
ncbi:hypothetical protein [uncultured Roseobacter sp.]|uniref:hypothetical protein n=1 Tax=uncultured Roseobacter sp. TaxID=114847 RepID=UPI0026110442|nr:hypothetical protein [uncultured Roseobacter sp.]